MNIDIASSLIGKYCIVRTYSAGVHAGTVTARNGQEVLLADSRRIWYWNGAASLSQLSAEGSKDQQACMFSMPISEILLTEAVEVIPCTTAAEMAIKGVPEWKVLASGLISGFGDSEGSSPGSGSAFGSGSGAGDEYGSGSGNVHGDGSGSGSSSGDGISSGSGSGSGINDGLSDGSGHGDGLASGSGSSSGYGYGGNGEDGRFVLAGGGD